MTDRDDRFPFVWLPVGEGRLALTHRPRRRWFPYLKEAGCDRLVTVLSAREGAREIGALARDGGLAWTWIPLDSGRPPGRKRDDTVREHLEALSGALDGGESILIHCSAGMHRTGMIAYALLRFRDFGRDETVELIGRMRPETVSGISTSHMEWGDRVAARAET